MVVAAIAAVGALGALVAIVARRPDTRGLTAGAGAALAIGLVGGAIVPSDLADAAHAQWRAMLTLLAVMVMTAAAEHVGVLARLAAAIEPRTRGPVRRAFAVTYVLAAVVASAISNDAAILVLTPAVLTLLRIVYPKRHPKFVAPFAFAVFVAAGVAPLVTSNPMNLVFADHVGIGFNRYALVMVPVALGSSLASYAGLRWWFRDALADEAPALGAWPGPPPALGVAGWLVVLAWAAVLTAYPITAYFGGPLWVVALVGAAACGGAALRARVPVRALVDGVAWGLFPFLACVFALALALQRLGAAEALQAAYAWGPAPIANIGIGSALGSAMINNHPMSVLSALALPAGHDVHAFAALIGGDLGPRLLPMGSLAGLLWLDVLRRHDVTVRLRTIVGVGLVTTVPALVVALLTLWLVG